MKDWVKIKQRTVFDKYRRIDQAIFLMPDGRKVDFYLNVEAPIVAILALTANQQVILCRQYRPGPGRIFDELPSGIIEPGENEFDAAARELAEETGYAGEIEYVSTFFRDGFSTGRCHCLAAHNCVQQGVPKPDQNEFLETAAVGLPEFRELLRQGKILQGAAAYQMLDYLNLL